MKIAIVYDRINKFGGAERILQVFHKIWPDAPIFTSVYNSKTALWAQHIKIIPSFLQRIPFLKSRHEIVAWLMPFVFETFNFDNYEVVISLTSADAKGIITKPHTFHFCYCLTPTRYLWSAEMEYWRNLPFGFFNIIVKILKKPLLSYLKKWDLISAQRPDVYLAISKTVQKRLKKYYQKRAEIIYPPVDLKKFKPLVGKNPSLDYFLVVSRLVSYKRIDLVIEAFNKLKIPLKIIGEGKERKKLERKARKNIEFLGFKLTDRQLISYYQNCRALVFAGEEDLGLVAVEALACGRPVIAYNKGGISEIVINGKTGILFKKQRVTEIIKAVENFEKLKFSSYFCRKSILKFGEENFRKKIKNKIKEEWRKYKRWILK